MLSCREIAQQSSDHLDRKLTFRESLRYGVHLLVCGYCRQFVRHLRTTIQVGQHLAEQNSLPDEEADRIAQAVFDSAAAPDATQKPSPHD